jgi:acyl-ACP thioesterase
MDLIFRKTYSVHSYETDPGGSARTTTLLNYLQDAAGDHAGRLGLSVVDLFKRRLTWVLSRTHVRIHRYPRTGEALEVTTWPSGKGGYFATRDFEVADAMGGAVLAATTSWMIIDLDRRQRVKVDDIIEIPYAVEKRALDDPFASLPVLAVRDAETGFRVEKAHLDWNKHVNNAVYVQWALEAVPQDILFARRPVDLEVSFRAEALYGDTVVSAVQRIAADAAAPQFLHQIFNAASGVELARLRTCWE